MRCLILYYSLTGQAEHAATLAGEAMLAKGWEVTACRIGMPDPADRLARPLSIADSKRWAQAAQKGVTVTIDFSPASAMSEPCDLVVLLSNTWGDHPSVPMQSFLAGEPARQVLKDRPFAVLVICRRLWKNNLEMVRRLGESAGGRFVGGEPFMHPGSGIGSLLQTVTYLWRNDGGRSRFLGFRLPPYGLSPEALARIPTFMQSVMEKLPSRH